jgi:hypothetical protein
VSDHQQGGKTTDRYRFIVVTQISMHPPAKDYIARRLAEGKD